MSLTPPTLLEMGIFQQQRIKPRRACPCLHGSARLSISRSEHNCSDLQEHMDESDSSQKSSCPPALIGRPLIISRKQPVMTTRQEPLNRNVSLDEASEGHKGTDVVSALSSEGGLTPSLPDPLEHGPARNENPASYGSSLARALNELEATHGRVPSSQLGLPSPDHRCTRIGSECQQRFEHSSLRRAPPRSSPRSGAHRSGGRCPW